MKRKKNISRDTSKELAQLMKEFIPGSKFDKMICINSKTNESFVFVFHEGPRESGIPIGEWVKLPKVEL